MFQNGNKCNDDYSVPDDCTNERRVRQLDKKVRRDVI